MEIHITNIYKECDVILTSAMVRNLLLANDIQHILLGDLNSQNTLWGSATNSMGGKIFEEFADDNGLIIMNDGSPTFLNTRNTLTSEDFTMASADLVPYLKWSCLSLPGVSEHFPLKISNNVDIVKRQCIPRFNDKRADYLLYKRKVLQFNKLSQISVNVNREAAQIKRLIRKAANESIP